jgi:serine/threonine-protein kinase RsbW
VIHDSTTPGEATVSLVIPAKAEYIVLCRLALAGLARLRPVEPDVLADLKLALTEACSNSIRHAYGDSRIGTVEIRYEVGGDRVAVEILDEGPGFEPRNEAPTDEVDEGGLGLAIIRAVVDELDVSANGNGSRVRFVKYLE